MFKKLLIALLLVVGMVSVAFADATVTTATKARLATQDKDVQGAYAIGDISSGYTQEVDSRGSASVLEYPKSVATVSGVDGAAVGSACRVVAINVAAPLASAGDYVNIYDAASATGTPKLEISLGTAKDSKSIVIPGGITFSTGVYVEQSADNALVSVIYDQ